MKPKFIQLIPMLLLLFSCQQKPAEGTTTPSADGTPISNSTDGPVITCYEGVTHQDTFRLRVENFENRVTGTLAYLFHEKDRNIGDYEGRMYGDTLIADYIFLSEGSSSVRQVAFLLKDQTAIEGYGQMAEKEGKMVFTDLGSLSYGTGVVMSKQNCLPDEKENSSSKNDLSGTWELNFISGSKIAFEKLYPGKKPQLVFAASAPDQFSGNTGCNSVRGDVQINDTQIKFKDPLAMTKMFCEGVDEEAFLALLKKVNIFDVNSKSLTLLVDDVEVLRFSKK